MKKKKKLISAGLSVLLAILCISGCNSSDTSGTTKANSSRTSDTTKADSSETQNTETTSVPESSTEQSTVIDDILSDFDYCAIDEDCIAITGYRGEGGMVEIPSTIDGMKVTIIGSLQQLVDGVQDGSGHISTPDQKETKPITGIKVPDTVKYIDEDAFKYCSDIENIELHDGLIQIGYQALRYTKWYESQPDGNVYIGNVYYTYKGDNYDDPGISIKDGTKVIAEGAFRNSDLGDALAGVVIPDSVEWIGKLAFQGPTTDDLVIPDSVTRVGAVSGLDYDDNGYNGKVYCRYVGSYGTQNALVTYDSTLGYDSDDDTDDDTQESLLIRGGTKCIADFALGFSTGGEALRYIQSVTSITLPDSLCDIGLRDPGYEELISLGNGNRGYGWGFDFLPNLTEIKVGENNQYYCSVDGVLFNKDKTELIAFPKSKSVDGYRIPDTVKKIGGNAFRNREDLTSIVIPESVTCIGNYAFTGTNLTSITIPDSVRYIGAYAFNNCKELTDVKIGSGVTVIGAAAFVGCENLTGTISIPDSTFRIENRAFANCSKIITLNMGSHVKYIGSEAFMGCQGISDVTLPDTLRNIGEAAFYECTGLSKVVIPKGITMIREKAFYGCTGITELELPEGLLAVDRKAFYNVSVKDLVIPYGVKCLGGSAFRYDQGDLGEDTEAYESTTEKPYRNFNTITFPETIISGTIKAENADVIFVGTQTSFNELPEKTRDELSKARSITFRSR